MSLNWLPDLLRSPDVAVFVIICLVLSVAYLWYRIRSLSYQYHQHDKILFVVSSEVVPHLIHVHRNGDYELVNPLNRYAEQAYNLRRSPLAPTEKESVSEVRPEMHGDGINGEGRHPPRCRPHKTPQQAPETSV